MQKLKIMSLTLVSALTMLAASATVAMVPSSQAFASDAVSCAYLPKSICDVAGKKTTTVQDSAIFMLLRIVLTAMVALVGIAAVGGVLWAGVLYTSAGGDTAKVKQAKTIIVNVAIGLITFGLMFLVINWLVPGGGVIG